MWKVTIFGANISIKQEHDFKEKKEADAYLLRENFMFDSSDENIHYWHLDGDTFALVEKL